MTHYLYIPFKRKDVPSNQKKMIEEWLLLEQKQKNEVVVCYYGEKKLKQRPQSAKITILFAGKPGNKSPLHGIDDIDTELLRHSEGLSQHLRVIYAHNNSILVPEVADKMKEDGLLDEFQGRLQINLIFLNANIKEAHTLAGSFFNSLKKYEEHKQGVIKLQYLANDSQEKSNSYPTYTHKKSQLELVKEPAIYTKHSMYNDKAHYPKLSVDEVASVVKAYYRYKSSRCCGLSGLLNLNGLFSSAASTEALKYLSKKDISDIDRYAYASRFIRYYKENHLSQFLNPVLENALQEHEATWNDQPTSSLNM
ncbi:hypothetical protein [Legionella maceachernii]|uniref:Uncharacterized protein n=2 Tax=Legionella maceachernii TaxID=466 RepID=A0A0W0VVV5_9GAMM|nr:hypothetical protein [Legionella maceachernii]KTD24184.1 hypothetical protein Lmac_3057 [Legionella maceachernii]SJZ88640.1 hypothetical protein SAMN02745128_01353 [Legionella maceachernii]SUO98801.1 Uncharacterised protein [Legionella maceachernii]